MQHKIVEKQGNSTQTVEKNTWSIQKNYKCRIERASSVGKNV